VSPLPVGDSDDYYVDDDASLVTTSASPSVTGTTTRSRSRSRSRTRTISTSPVSATVSASPAESATGSRSPSPSRSASRSRTSSNSRRYSSKSVTSSTSDTPLPSGGDAYYEDDDYATQSESLSETGSIVGTASSLASETSTASMTVTATTSQSASISQAVATLPSFSSQPAAGSASLIAKVGIAGTIGIGVAICAALVCMLGACTWFFLKNRVKVTVQTKRSPASLRTKDTETDSKVSGAHKNVTSQSSSDRRRRAEHSARKVGSSLHSVDDADSTAYGSNHSEKRIRWALPSGSKTSARKGEVRTQRLTVTPNRRSGFLFSSTANERPSRTSRFGYSRRVSVIDHDFKKRRQFNHHFGGKVVVLDHDAPQLEDPRDASRIVCDQFAVLHPVPSRHDIKLSRLHALETSAAASPISVPVSVAGRVDRGSISRIQRQNITVS
jgi:hypothetical protein